MNWQDELARRIAAMTDADWDADAALHGDGPEWAGFVVPCSPAFARRRHATLVEAIGHVNDREFAGRPCGMILFVGASWDERGAHMNIGVRRSVPWDVGGPMPGSCAAFNFDRLAETWMDRGPLL